ncbi:MAG: Crp/Fnr family transcriptional regulator [Phyllobacteriaceae bacterium]|nr:Crp/Fnr family transcriptional regulator [Phyllobacteriaceae bacterium]
MPLSRPAFLAFAQTLSKAVAPLVPGEAALGALAAASDILGFSKGDHLLREGEVAGYLLFVSRGLLRYYYLDAATGEERTGQFFDEGQVFTDAASFLSQTPATQFIDALEAGEVLRIPRQALYDAYTQDHAIERFGRLMLENALVGSQRRAGNLLRLPPEELYRTFVTTRPEVARRVPQYLIAGYLGITPEALSRIRGRLARQPGGQ